MKVQNSLVAPLILYGSEIWTFRKSIKAIGFVRDKRFLKNLFGHKMNEEIFEELKVEQVDEKQIRLATIYGRY
jgi:hypothetical protein